MWWTWICSMSSFRRFKVKSACMCEPEIGLSLSLSLSLLFNTTLCLLYGKHRERERERIHNAIVVYYYYSSSSTVQYGPYYCSTIVLQVKVLFVYILIIAWLRLLWQLSKYTVHCSALHAVPGSDSPCVKQWSLDQ